VAAWALRHTPAMAAMTFQLRQPIPLGRILTPLPDFRGMSPNPKGDMFEGVNLGRPAVKNRNTYKVGDGHATMTTGRTLEKGSVSYCAFDWRYDELIQTGRNLVWQLQMDGSPIFALSTLNGQWSAVDRVGGVMHRKVLGPVPFGHWAYFVAGVRLADFGGFVELWWGVDDWPDVTTAPVVRRDGDTWQGRTGHHTIGQYSSHSKPGQYVGFFSRFGRDTTAQRAVELAS
jgi:hypothetical protein